MQQSRRGPLDRRNATTIVFLVFVAAGLVLVFAGTLTRATSLEAEAAQARAEVAALQARVEAGRDEIEFLETEAFVDQVARSVGWGLKGERPFALRGDAPSPAPVVPLGAAREEGAAGSPFEEWMDLLFGS